VTSRAEVARTLEHVESLRNRLGLMIVVGLFTPLRPSVAHALHDLVPAGRNPEEPAEQFEATAQAIRN